MLHTGPMIEHRWAGNGDVRVHYLDSGGDGTVVFLPGFGESADEYGWLAERLSPRRTIVIDLRGRGASDVPERGYDLRHHLGDLDAVLDDAGVGAFHLACYSRGNAYGLGWAIDHPGRVRSVLVGDYFAVHPQVPPAYLKRFIRSSWRGRPVADRLSPIAAEGILREAMAVSYWERLGVIEAPMLLIRGGNGGLVDGDTLARWQEHRPGIDVVVFEESGHDLFAPDRERFADVLVGFVEAAEAADTVVP
jgi:non-heme chloroperoxidase